SSIGPLPRQRLGDTRGGRRRGACDKFGKPGEGLCGRCQGELVLRAQRAAQAKAAEPQKALEVGGQRLDPPAVVARLLKGLGFAEPTSNVAGVLVDAARDLARWLLRAASHLEWAYIAIELARPVEQLLVIHDLARGGEALTSGARVDVTLLVE